MAMPVLPLRGTGVPPVSGVSRAGGPCHSEASQPQGPETAFALLLTPLLARAGDELPLPATQGAVLVSEDFSATNVIAKYRRRAARRPAARSTNRAMTTRLPHRNLTTKLPLPMSRSSLTTNSTIPAPFTIDPAAAGRRTPVLSCRVERASAHSLPRRNSSRNRA